MTALVHVVETLERGGLERMVCDLAAEQARRGMRVSVICLYRKGLLAAELESAGIEVYSADKSTRGNLVALWRLRQRLRAAVPNIVHTHNATANYLTVLATLGLGLPIVCTRHGMGGGLGVDRREKYFKKSVSRTARVVTVCRHAANHFLGQELVPSAKLEVIGNGIVLSRFAQSDRVAARDALGLSAGGLVVGTVGRLNWAKDHNLFLDVAALLKTQIPGCRFVIIGSGEKRAELEREIERLGLGDRVLLAGDRSDVPILLAGFDVFALTSRTEGYSLALLEAAAAGLPAVATDVGGNREIVHDGINGMVVAHGEPQAFATALDRLLSDTARREQYSRAARDWAQKNASVEAMADNYAALYASVGMDGKS